MDILCVVKNIGKSVKYISFGYLIWRHIHTPTGKHVSSKLPISLEIFSKKHYVYCQKSPDSFDFSYFVECIKKYVTIHPEIAEYKDHI